MLKETIIALLRYMIPKGLAIIINCKPNIESIHSAWFNQQQTSLPSRTSQEMITLLKLECQKQLKHNYYTLTHLQSACSSSTMNNIKHFLRSCAAERFTSLTSTSQETGPKR